VRDLTYEAINIAKTQIDPITDQVIARAKQQVDPITDQVIARARTQIDSITDEILVAAEPKIKQIAEEAVTSGAIATEIADTKKQAMIGGAVVIVSTAVLTYALVKLL
jgi:vacuolar-type H+-ATPase subunit H